MKTLLPIVTVLALSFSSPVFAHGEDATTPHTDHPDTQQREGGVNPAVAVGFGVIVVGLIGFFAYNKFRGKKGPPPPPAA